MYGTWHMKISQIVNSHWLQLVQVLQLQVQVNYPVLNGITPRVGIISENHPVVIVSTADEYFFLMSIQLGLKRKCVCYNVRK